MKTGSSFPNLSIGIEWLQNKSILSAALPLFAGLVLAVMVIALGAISLPGVVFILLILPWLLKNPFRMYLWLIITWPILTLFLRVPLPAGIPDISYDRMFVLILLVMMLVEGMLLSRRFLKVTMMDNLVILYVVAQLSSRLFVLWFGGTGKPDFNGLLDIIIIPVIMYWITKNLLTSKSRYKWLLRTIIVASFLICLTGLYEQAAGVRIFKSSVALGGSEERYIWQDVQGGRAAGALGNPAIYGAVVGIGCLAGVAYLPHLKRRIPKLGLIASIVIMLYGVYACYTRSAWVSVLLVLFAAQFLIKGLWKKTIPILIVAIVLFALLWQDIPGISAAYRRATYTNSLPVRVTLLKIGLDRFLQKPILGWGSGAINDFARNIVGDISHNIYLTFLVDGGVVLFLSFVAAMVYLLLRAVRLYKKLGQNLLERDVLVAVTGSVLIFLISGLFLELRYSGYFNMLFWVSASAIDSLGIRYLDE